MKEWNITEFVFVTDDYGKTDILKNSETSSDASVIDMLRLFLAQL
ncbi:hypothetical protein GCM10008986_09030 [Salinibacillus aidingensis]|uniref:Uncharacterized protein n=1 Tax=Salinibacillus aidingensis TaxID=237684 RepID=A0ABP3KRU0_9BACI